jgi:hypothetical protein
VGQPEEVTRFTTPEEREEIAGIELDPADVDHFMDMVRKGLIEAAAQHESAVQKNFALSAETSIRLSRPVRGDNGEVTELVGRHLTAGRVRARKVYKPGGEPPSET